jgi:prohibitin 2
MANIIKLAKTVAPLVTLVGFGAYGISKCIYKVNAGERAIKFNRFFGVMPKHHLEGWHIFLPYFEWPIIYDVKTNAKSSESQTGTKDLQTAFITVRVLYKPMPDRLNDLYREVGEDYDDRVLPSIINEIVKIVVVNLECKVGEV